MDYRSKCTTQNYTNPRQIYKFPRKNLDDLGFGDNFLDTTDQNHNHERKN